MKIGIISSDFVDYHDVDDLSYENKRLKLAAQNVFGNCLIIDPSKIEVVFNNKEINVYYFGENNEGNINILNELDVLIIRRTRNFLEQILDIVNIVSTRKKIEIFDRPETFIRPTSKVISILARFGTFKQPRTQVLFDLDCKFEDLEIDFPVLVKPTHGYKGKNIKIFLNERTFKKEINDFISKLKEAKKREKDAQIIGYGILIQEYIAFDEEYRVNVIDGKSIGCVLKRGGKQGINNADQNAEFLKSDNKKVIKLAEQVAKFHNLTFAGVDIGIKDNELYVIECNRNPAFERFDYALNQDSARIFIEHIFNSLKEKQKQSMLCKKNNGKNNKDYIIIKNFGKSIKRENTLIVKNSIKADRVYIHSSHYEENIQNDIEVEKIIQSLIKIIVDAKLDNFTKKDALNELNALKDLNCQKNKTEVLLSIERKLTTLNNIIKNSENLLESARPLLIKLSEYFFS